MIYQYKGIRPRIADNVFLAPGVIVLGDVEIGQDSNLWFYTVVRGDVHRVTIGKGVNIQDHCMLHVTGGRFPLSLGDGVIVGHRAVLHGCTIHANALIGIGALILDGAVVEQGAMVAAGAVVAPGAIIPANQVAVGIPARAMRETTEQEQQLNRANAVRYQEYGRQFHAVTSSVET